MGAHAEQRTLATAGPALPERYRPLRLIASGGTAHVWCAEDRSLTRRVAVKLLAEPFASDPAARRRFARESRASAHLSAHPHVVTIYDVGETEPGDGGAPAPFIVMEHLPGGTVADALRVGELTPDDAVRWIHEAASALDYAHAKGIVHRDIKPANLLLDRHRSLHVADFGIAQIGRDDSLTIAGEVLGTASYLAPERAVGRPATMASDLYSLAVTAFELLAGQRPFPATSYVAQARQHLEDDPPAASTVNPRLPAALDAVLARGMAKAPEQRWPSAGAFADAVSTALAPAPAPEDATTRVRRAAAVAAYAQSDPQTAARRRTAPRLAPRPVAAPRPSRQHVFAVPVAATTVRPAFADAAAAAPTRSRRRPAVPVQARRPAPATQAARTSERRERTRRVALLPLGGALLSLAAVVIGVLWIISSSASTHAPARAAAVTAPKATAHPAAIRRRRAIAAPKAKPRPKPVIHAATPVVATPVPPASDALEARGHALLYGGSPAASIPVLRQAVSSASPASLTYAYALFDLAHALRLSGDPKAAVPLLVQRLKIPNQTDKVKAELVLALQAVARQDGALPSGGASPDSGAGAANGNASPALPVPGRARGRDHRGPATPGQSGAPGPTAND